VATVIDCFSVPALSDQVHHKLDFCVPQKIYFSNVRSGDLSNRARIPHSTTQALSLVLVAGPNIVNGAL
jgi:hypothetical protein